MEPPAGQTFVLLSRPGCGLCEEMERAYAALSRRVPLPPLVVQDVDADPVTARRYGLEIPVLLLEGIVACKVEFDAAEVLRLTRPRI